MGYMTSYSLNIVVGQVPDDFGKVFNKLTGYTLDALYCKWYEFDEHMTTLSKLYPNVVFQLDGDGEDADDKWRYYFCNGKSQDASPEIVYPEINYEQLDNIKKRSPELFI